MIIDCHCHAGTGDGLTGPWDTRADLTAYLARAKDAGIDRTVLFAVFTSDYARANREVARIVGERPDRFWGFVFVHAERDRARMGRLVHEAVVEHGFCGIKVHRHDGRITREVCEAARYWRLPVIYDVMGDVAAVELLATEYPAVPFIIPHLGSFADDWRAQRQVIDHMTRHPNIFADTSGVRRFDLLVEAVDRAGPHKLLFGTDGPWLHPGLELAKIRALQLPSSAERLVMGGTIHRLVNRVRGSGGGVPTPRATRPLTAPSDPWLSAGTDVMP